MLRGNYTFDQFVVGENNGFAYSAALSLASKKNNQQNALFLLSKTGNGKSHLSQAVGHHILSEYPTERVCYITAEDFANEMVYAFQANSINKFKDKYRGKCDVLLLEDVHYLTGKNRTQIELALTLDTLFDANKKIIFSSCYLPGDIPKLNDKLRSRLSCGLISAMETPDYRTRVRILKKKSLLKEKNNISTVVSPPETTPEAILAKVLAGRKKLPHDAAATPANVNKTPRKPATTQIAAPQEPGPEQKKQSLEKSISNIKRIMSRSKDSQEGEGKEMNEVWKKLLQSLEKEKQDVNSTK